VIYILQDELPYVFGSRCILSVGGAESMMLSALSALALRVSILSANAESIILSAPPAESMILSAPPADATPKHRHGTSTMRRAFT
jgi:hypothetical protein